MKSTAIDPPSTPVETSRRNFLATLVGVRRPRPSPTHRDLAPDPGTPEVTRVGFRPKEDYHA